MTLFVLSLHEKQSQTDHLKVLVDDCEANRRTNIQNVRFFWHNHLHDFTNQCWQVSNHEDILQLSKMLNPSVAPVAYGWCKHQILMCEKISVWTYKAQSKFQCKQYLYLAFAGIKGKNVNVSRSEFLGENEWCLQNCRSHWLIPGAVNRIFSNNPLPETAGSQLTKSHRCM